MRISTQNILKTPPLLSLGGKIRPGAKSDLLHCFELHEKRLLQAPDVDAIFLDGVVVVHMLHPGIARTFQDYADMVFSSYTSGTKNFEFVGIDVCNNKLIYSNI